MRFLKPYRFDFFKKSEINIPEMKENDGFKRPTKNDGYRK